MSQVRRFDHVGITVADLDAVTAFFVGLGLELENRMFVEGDLLDTVIGIPDSRTEIVMPQPPDGAGGWSSQASPGQTTCPVRWPNASAEPRKPDRGAEHSGVGAGPVIGNLPLTKLPSPLRPCRAEGRLPIPAISSAPRPQRAEISSPARLATYWATDAPASPQFATREHVEERHQGDETEHGPCQLRAAPDIPAGGQVNPHQDHGNGMEETDQDFENLLHRLNLPGAVWAPVRYPARLWAMSAVMAVTGRR